MEQSGLTLYEYHVELGDAFVSVQISASAPAGKWTSFKEDEHGRLARNEEVDSELLVTLASSIPFNCRFQFGSAQELAANTSRAMDHCVRQQVVTVAYPDACQ